MRRLLALAAASLISFTACDDSNDPAPAPTVPETYTFENVDYSGQTARIQMLGLLETTAKSANDGTTKVTAAELQSIYQNTSGDLFGSSKDLRSKTYSATVPEILGYFTMVEELSGSQDNVIGGRLISPEGIEPVQMIGKGLMGAVLYYQANNVYLAEGKMNADNSEVTEGKGTAMQHHWDEAFGYFGAPVDYLTATNAAENSKYWAHYANQMAPAVDLREAIFTAFIEGRAAIDRNDLEARDAAISTIRTNWDKLVAAITVHYINSSLEDLDNSDMASLYHYWSEAKAFAASLNKNYNPETALSSENYSQLMNLLGQTPQAESLLQNLRDANVLLQQAYGFSNAEMQNL